MADLRRGRRESRERERCSRLVHTIAPRIKVKARQGRAGKGRAGWAGLGLRNC